MTATVVRLVTSTTAGATQPRKVAPLKIGIYGFHRCHSIAHEVVDIAVGELRVPLDGSSGDEITVQIGAWW